LKQGKTQALFTAISIPFLRNSAQAARQRQNLNFILLATFIPPTI
jgi:hypothetical protein